MSKIYRVPNYKKPAHIPQPARVQETMSLLEELKDTGEQIKRLKAKQKELRRLLNGVPTSKIISSGYLSKTIKLYALLCSDGCYYVGISRNPEKRFKRHQNGKGANWTKLHKPLEVIEIIDTNLTVFAEAALLEDEMTISYARRYGAQFVRGGGYCQTKPHWPTIAHEPDLSWIIAT